MNDQDIIAVMRDPQHTSTIRLSLMKALHEYIGLQLLTPNDTESFAFYEKRIQMVKDTYNALFLPKI